MEEIDLEVGGNESDSSRCVTTRSRNENTNPNQVPTVISNDKCGACNLSVGNYGIGCGVQHGIT